MQTAATAIQDKSGRVLGATIDMGYAVPFDAQVEEFDEQNLTGETDAVYGETTRFVDDLQQEAVVVARVGSRVPR